MRLPFTSISLCLSYTHHFVPFYQVIESEASVGVGGAEWVALEGPKRSHVTLKKKMLSLKTVNMEPTRAQGTKRHGLQQLK